MTSKNPPQFESHPVVPLLVMKETSAPFKCGITKKRFMFVHGYRFYCSNDPLNFPEDGSRFVSNYMNVSVKINNMA